MGLDGKATTKSKPLSFRFIFSFAEGELASGVREQLYNTKLGDVYKFAAVNLDEMTKGFTEPSSEKLIPVNIL